MLASSRRTATRAAELIAQARPFVLATVVRAQCPTSTRPGDAAVVLPDGSIEGFVGGQCAEGSVRTASLAALESAEAVLLRILPEGSESYPDVPGAVTTVNPCLSGGALEIYLEPKLPAPVLMIVGRTPIASALADLAPSLGLRVAIVEGVDEQAADLTRTTALAEATAVVIASHGRYEPESIRGALAAGVGFIGLVASQTRGSAVLDELGLGDEERKRVRTPVGINIGARTAEEIALSILAELVQAVRLGGLRAPESGPGQSDSPVPATATDPVCQMTVTVTADTPHLRHNGTDYWFCNPGCRTRFAEQVGAAR